MLNAGTISTDSSITFFNQHSTLIIGSNTLATIDTRATDNASPTIVANPNLGVPLIGNFGATLLSFKAGDLIQVQTTVAASFIRDANNTAVVDVVETANTGHILGKLTFSSTGSASVALSNTAYLSNVVVLCFLKDTLIRTPQGDVPVQHLRPGDPVLTASGSPRPVAWLGQGKVLATSGQRSAATPVIVRKSALGPNVPHTDLHVTKGHSLFLDGALIPVEFLINHRTILWDDRAQEVELYHIELNTHDVLLANGAPAESYRDDGNRWLFQNASTGWDRPPQSPCAPVLTGGPVVDSVWHRLLAQAGHATEPELTDDPDLHVLADGVRVPARHTGNNVSFKLPAVPAELRILSRASVPAELGFARDPRALGVAIRRICLFKGPNGIAIEASDTRLTTGFHDYEPELGHRWTNGSALLPTTLFPAATGPIDLQLTLGSSTRYRAEPAPARQAAA